MDNRIRWRKLDKENKERKEGKFNQTQRRRKIKIEWDKERKDKRSN